MTATISSRHAMASRRTERQRGANACKRIRSLPIMPNIVEWIKEGLSAAEVARRIQANGFLKDLPFRKLRREIIRYARDVMDPAEVLEARKMSSLHRHAERALNKAIQELPELADLYRIQKTIFCEVVALSPAPGTVGRSTASPSASRAAALSRADEAFRNSDTTEQTTNPCGRPLSFAEMVRLLVEMRQTLTTHARLRQRLEALGDGADASQTQAAGPQPPVAIGRFAGRADVQTVLLDPERRHRVLSLLLRFLTAEMTQKSSGDPDERSPERPTET